MTKQASIQYISSLINNPAAITDGDQSSIAVLRQKYPYFVPVRYILALESHKKSAWQPAMLSAIQPYTGNWMLFCDFLEAGSTGEIAGQAQQDLTANELQPVDEVAAAADSNEPEQTQEEVTTDTKQEDIAVPDEEYAFVAATMEDPIFAQALAEEQPILSQDEDVVTVESNVHEDILPVEAASPGKEKDSLIIPIHSQDYFLHQGERVSEAIPAEIEELKVTAVEPSTVGTGEDEEAKSLMVMMSFTEWLKHFKHSSEKHKEEVKDKKALKTMWQKEKLAAAMEEENEEIPENVFEMAVNSITKEDGLASETLAEIYMKQGKYDQSIEMYRKLSLRNPQKNVYFARKIDEVLKEKQS